MPTITVKVDDAFLRRINKVCEWSKQTQQQLMNEALEDKIKPYKKQLDELEKAEEKIRRTLPMATSESAKVTK
jgi:predicted transcriptional regulator